MPDALSQILALPGLGTLVIATFIAGIVYGFSGFGSAMIFMPVAVGIIPIEMAVGAFAISALASFITVVPKAWRHVDRRGLSILIGTATLSASLGLWVLRLADVTLLRWAVIAVCAVTLMALITGWRQKTIPTDLTRVGVGAASGFIGGSTGMLGPVLVLFQLAGKDSITQSRATTLVFLTVTSLLLLPLMALQGLLSVTALTLGFLLLIPYGAGTQFGQMLFQPERERLYRWVAYFIILVAILTGLPVWDARG